MPSRPTVIYTLTDEAPRLATYSLLPIVRSFAARAGIDVTTSDISLAARVLAQFPEFLGDDAVPDGLEALGRMVMRPEANIIKLPNISASVPQLKAAIAELQAGGFDIPSYPETPSSDAEKDIRARYDRVKGSAVNPVLRQGNSDRRAPASVKAYARRHPHAMGAWDPASRTRVATMTDGDFRHTEDSLAAPSDDVFSIRLRPADGSAPVVLREGVDVLAGDVVDAAKMSAGALTAFLREQVAAARDEGLLFCPHLKATMMKVSDPIIFGHVIRAMLPEVFERHGAALAAAGVSANNGLGPMIAASDPRTDEGVAIRQAIADGIAAGSDLAMVDSDRGITCLHVPSDVIVDASMPAMIRAGGKAWGPDGTERETLAVIPDSTYAGVYQAVIDDCRARGALDPATMGTVPNVGLMAKAAEEYGSHTMTIEVPCDGVIEVVSTTGAVAISHEVAAGDIWRACRTRDDAIRDWVALAVRRARETGTPAVFWLDATRPHDAVLIAKLEQYLPLEPTDGLDIYVMAPAEACAFTLARLREGLDTISVTGNVLRDYLTDLFPILEVGTSAKMLSIVPLMAGGGLFETGAGGSAPKHVQQLLSQNYLRWDSLGEFFALAASFDQLAQTSGLAAAGVLAQTLDAATGRFLEDDRSPGRRLGTIDNRGSHYYLARYWAEELAAQTCDASLASAFAPVASALVEGEAAIVAELAAVQGAGADVGGYYLPDDAKADAVMRPSATLNEALALLAAD